MQLNLLSVSDRISELVYSPSARARFGETQLALSCGDLPYYYVEFLVSALNVPVFFVRGNHARTIEVTDDGSLLSAPRGAINLHRRVMNYNGLLLAGMEGSIRYKPGPFQYTQNQMWRYIFQMTPALLYNRIRYGRALDVFVTHASPWGIHDLPDFPHQGVRAFNWLLKTFKPPYHLHGHIHLYGVESVWQTQFGATQIINTYGFRQTLLNLPHLNDPRWRRKAAA